MPLVVNCVAYRLYAYSPANAPAALDGRADIGVAGADRGTGSAALTATGLINRTRRSNQILETKISIAKCVKVGSTADVRRVHAQPMAPLNLRLSPPNTVEPHVPPRGSAPARRVRA